MPRSLLLALLCTATLLPACGSDATLALDDDAELAGGDLGKADSLSSTSTYFRGRPDARKCASPMCGGTWVSRPNYGTTTCADKSRAAECYVFALDLSSLKLEDATVAAVTSGFDSGSVLLRGKLVVGDRGIGKLVASEAWMAPSDVPPVGGDLLYRINDSGIRCVKAPCPSLHAAKLNSTSSSNVATLDMSAVKGASADDKLAARLEAATGVLLAAHATTPGNGGGNGGATLMASQLYRRVRAGGTPCGNGSALCGPSLLCCYPCGVQGCTDRCMPPATDGKCPLFP